MKLIPLLLAIAGSALALSARITVGPEIDPAGALNAVLLVSGAIVVIRGRRKK